MGPLEVMGVLLIIVGLLLIVLALLLPYKKFGDYSVGGIILIGPIPIVFGKNIRTSLLIVLVAASLLLMLTSMILMGAWS